MVPQQVLGLNEQREQAQQREELQEDDPLCLSFRLSRESDARKVNFRAHLEFIFQHSGLADQCWRFLEGDDMGSTVVKKSLEKREEENHKTTQVDEKNSILVDPLETDNRMEEGKIKRLEETQKKKRMGVNVVK